MTVRRSSPRDGPAVRTLLAGGAPEMRRRIARVFIDAGCLIVTEQPEVVVLLQDGVDDAGAVRAARARHAPAPLVFVATTGSERLAVAAFRAGASDYLSWPAAPEEVTVALGRWLPAATPTGLDTTLVGDSPAMCEARDRLRRLADTPCNVLVCGETGTGKELAARALHRWSRRAAGPFVSINCSAVPETLFESELFGFERGAFTGATASSAGRLRSASGGTVFLDEVGELPLAAQPKLLRAIEQREIQRLGSDRSDRIDVRWVAATNRDLAAMAERGRFRLDLLYRLNVCAVSIPPLRERREDIPVLAEAFLSQLGPAYARPGARFTPSAIDRLLAHDWPGNVRELRNIVESSLIQATTDGLDADALPVGLRAHTIASPVDDAVEFRRVVEALRAAHGNKSEAAHRLRWSRMTLYRKIARYRIDVTAACDDVTPPVSQV